ncbi:hypothetical protein [Vulgatibacter sp.]|uniref:hypothetical protein n=1 Tax=Vulgatibacter sp. TaxID=1971226 RepID=UPI00356AF730
MRLQFRSFASSVLALSLAACGTEDEGGSGELMLSLSGEEAAQTGFPVPGSDELVFADGWSVRFEKYLVGIGRVRVAGADGNGAVADDEVVVADLTAGEQEVFRFEGLGARRWERFGYDIVAPTATARAVGTVDAADVQRMIDGGFNYWIEGTASRGDVHITFAWGLAAPTANDDCVNSADDSPGVVVRNNGTAAYQITLHLDHLFYDTLGSHAGVELRFDAIAAVADDGVVAWEDLTAQRLADLRDTSGGPLLDEQGNRIVYDPESVPLGDANLQAYLLAASRSQGRFNGEGTCVNRGL